jgi:hypothetical protein
MTSHPTHTDECYQKAKARNQRTFTLVEQDRSTVEVIAFWILQNIHTAPAEKLHSALDDAIEMRDYPAVKDAD